MADAEQDGGSFPGRWSERKLRAREAAEPGDRPAGAGVEAQAPGDTTGDPRECPVLTDADMPSLEWLDEGSDYSGFLSPGVSEELRRKALSKLFHGAGLNIADGLDDYDEDFTSFLPLGDIITSDMRHQMEGAAKRLLADGENPAAADELTDETASTSSRPEPDECEERTDGDPV
jgi:hypothetical protein